MPHQGMGCARNRNGSAADAAEILIRVDAVAGGPNRRRYRAMRERETLLGGARRAAVCGLTITFGRVKVKDFISTRSSGAGLQRT